MIFEPCKIAKDIIVNWDYDKYIKTKNKYAFFLSVTYPKMIDEHNQQIKSLERLLHNVNNSKNNLDSKKIIAANTFALLLGLKDVRAETYQKNLVTDEIKNKKQKTKKTKEAKIAELKKQLAELENN